MNHPSDAAVRFASGDPAVRAVVHGFQILLLGHTCELRLRVPILERCESRKPLKIGRVPRRQTGRRQLTHPSRVTCRASVSNSCPSSLRVADPRWPLHSSTHPATRTDHDFRISPSVAAFVGASSSTVAASGWWCAAASSMLWRDDYHRCAAGCGREDLQISR